jgi:hypothetical protein
MRMTQLSQAIKGLPADPSDEQDPAKQVQECLRILRRAKAYLWHGSPHRALETLEDLTWEIGTESDHANAMQDKLEEFMGYVTASLIRSLTMRTASGTASPSRPASSNPPSTKLSASGL